MRALIAVAAALAVSGCLEAYFAPAGLDAGDPIPFTKLAEGLQSGHRERIVTTIEDASVWETFWAKHDRTGDQPAPVVDFGRLSVAVVVLGEKSTGCYAVSIAEVARDEASRRDVVRYVERVPGEPAFCTQAISSPFSFAAFERRYAVVFDRGFMPTPPPDPRPTHSGPNWTAINRGSHSGFPEATKRVIDDQPSWDSFWALHDASEPATEVDFSKVRVAAIVLGERSNACYAVRVEAVERDAETDETVIRYAESRPGPGRSCAEVITNPYEFITFTPVAGGVRFEGRVVTV